MSTCILSPGTPSGLDLSKSCAHPVHASMISEFTHMAFLLSLGLVFLMSSSSLALTLFLPSLLHGFLSPEGVGVEGNIPFSTVYSKVSPSLSFLRKSKKIWIWVGEEVSTPTTLETLWEWKP